MSDISRYLDTIENAIYGADMRSAIHDALEICSNDIDTLDGEMDKVKDFLTVYEERSASTTVEDAYYAFSNGVLGQGHSENYTCTGYFGLDLTETWAVTAVCNDTSIPVVVICPNGSGDLQTDCAIVSATETGNIEKGLDFNKKSTGYSEDYGVVYINSYSSDAPILYKVVSDLDIYTKDETDAAIANAINSAINNVINTAY